MVPSGPCLIGGSPVLCPCSRGLALGRELPSSCHRWTGGRLPLLFRSSSWPVLEAGLWVCTHRGLLSWLRGPWGGEGLGAEAWLLTLPQQGGLCQVPLVKASGARESGLEPGLAGQLHPGVVPVEASPSTLAACGLLLARPPDPPPLEAAEPRPDPFPLTPCSLLSARPRGPRGPVGSPLPVSLQGSPELLPLAGPSRLLAWGPSPWKWSLRGRGRAHRVCSLHR